MANKPSSIDRLPDEVKSSIAGLRRQGRTIDEILDHLRQLEVDVSRSALGRHVKSLAEIGEQLRRSETMAKFIVDRFGEDTDERVGRANMRILQGALLEILTEERIDEDGQPVTLSAKEAKELALSLQRLVSAQRMDVDRELKVQDATRRKAAVAATKTAKAAGLTADKVREIERAILGVDT